MVGDDVTDIVNVHVVLPNGTIVLAVDAMSTAGGWLVGARGRACGVQLEIASMIPVPVRGRIQSRVSVSGTVRPFDPTLLDDCDSDTVLALLDLPAVALWSIEPETINLHRPTTTNTVPVTEYRNARPDRRVSGG